MTDTQPSVTVAVADQGGQLERVEADPERRRLNALYRECQKLAASELVPKALRGKPDNVFALARYGELLGLPPVHAVQRVYIVEGSFEPKAEVLAGVIMRAGHELAWDETSEQQCTVSIRRAGSDRWQSTTWTVDQARRAGLLDLWVERWVKDAENRSRKEVCVVGDDTGLFTQEERTVRGLGPVPKWAQDMLDAGHLKRKDPWFNFREDLLAAKALKRAAKRICPDAFLGMALEDELPMQAFAPSPVRDEPTAAQVSPSAPAANQRQEEVQPQPAPQAGGGGEDIIDAEIVGEPAGPPAGDDDGSHEPAAVEPTGEAPGGALVPPPGHPTPQPMNPAQSRRLHALLREKRGAVGPARHRVLTELLGRTITSANDLTAAEASAAINTLADEADLPPAEAER